MVVGEPLEDGELRCFLTASTRSTMESRMYTVAAPIARDSHDQQLSKRQHFVYDEVLVRPLASSDADHCVHMPTHAASGEIQEAAEGVQSVRQALHKEPRRGTSDAIR
jgi:hypothetical protein